MNKLIKFYSVNRIKIITNILIQLISVKLKNLRIQMIILFMKLNPILNNNKKYILI